MRLVGPCIIVGIPVRDCISINVRSSTLTAPLRPCIIIGMRGSIMVMKAQTIIAPKIKRRVLWTQSSPKKKRFESSWAIGRPCTPVRQLHNT